MDSIELSTVQRKLLEELRVPRVTIEFQNLTYILPGKTKKQILHSLNGKFSAGEITAILGPSGAGKTMLLNILAGYIFKGTTGIIKVNDQPRRIKEFQKMYAFIMQEDLLQPKLTLKESITAATNIKLGNILTRHDKQEMINEILDTLGLQNCLDTRVELLSGGERKRLSLALEMVSNPSVIFLDEPTSGLDIVATKQCIEVLKNLKQKGRTVICTIHQPSNNILQEFNQVYFLANGSCVYNGTPANILPFLKSINLECPITYNPAEFVIEVVQTNEEWIPIMAAATRNGKAKLTLIESKEPETTHSKVKLTEFKEQVCNIKKHSGVPPNYLSSFWTQFYVIFVRMMLQTRRSQTALLMQALNNFFIAGFMGVIFFNIGHRAEMVVANFKMFMFMVFFYMYVPLITNCVLYPLEIPLVKKEYSNHWYGVKPYFLALTLRNLPVVATTGLVFLVTIYLMSSQPLEIDRFMAFVGITILLGMVSDSAGLALGSIMNPQTGLFSSIVIYGPGAFFCIYGMGYVKDVSPVMKFFMNTNYVRCSVALLCQIAFTNRTRLDCDDYFCRYSKPELLLKDFGLNDFSVGMNILVLIVTFVIFKYIAFIALKFRLSSEYSYRIHYIKSKFRGISKVKVGKLFRLNK